MRKRADDSAPNSKGRRMSHQKQSLLHVRIDDDLVAEAIELCGAAISN
jgi:hypothetical protein